MIDGFGFCLFVAGKADPCLFEKRVWEQNELSIRTLVNTTVYIAPWPGTTDNHMHC